LDELAGGGVEGEDEGSSRSVQSAGAVDAIQVESRRDDSVTAVGNSIAKVVTSVDLLGNKLCLQAISVRYNYKTGDDSIAFSDLPACKP
jgi:hypothetical protein